MSLRDCNMWLFAAAVAGLGALAGCGEEPEAQISQVEEPAVVDASGDDYPLSTCVVSGKALGSMGEPHVIEHDGQKVKFCCAACTDGFEQDPEGHIAKIEEAESS